MILGRRTRTWKPAIWRLTVMVATIAGVPALKWLVLIAKLHLLLRGIVRALLAICMILRLWALLWGIIALAICRRVGIHTTIYVSLGGGSYLSNTYPGWP